MSTIKMKYRKKLTILAIALITLFSLVIPNFSARSTSSMTVIVQGSSSDEVAQVVEKYGGEVTSHLEIINGVGATISEDAFAQLLSNPLISSIMPDAEVTLTKKGDDEEKDKEKDRAEDKKEEGKKEAPATNYPNVTGADEVWENGTIGRGVTVAVVDTGIAPNELWSGREKKESSLIGWVDFVDNKKKPRDPNGHGTHISGIIANAQIGEDGEYNGIAPGANIVSVRVLDKEGFGTYEQVIQGIQWVVKNKDKYDIKVMNLSLVSSVQSPYWADPLNQAVTRAWAEGIAVVVAAGNGGPDPMTIGVPGNNPYVITVGAFTDDYTPNDWSDDYIAPFSAAGPTLDGFVKPDLVAPGAHMLSPMPQNSTLAHLYKENRVGRNYYAIAGTSQAAAVVSGVTALTLDQNPALTPDELKYRLMGTSLLWVDMETKDALYSMWQQGMGRVNAPDAVYTDITGVANLGMDIEADLAGKQHYEGHTYYDEELGQFVLRSGFGAWAGGFGAWAGDFGAWAGGFGAWAGGFGAWAGDFGAWAGDFGAWAGGFGAWAGGFGAWAGDFGAWAGDFGAWAGGFGAWAGGFGAWAGGFGAWAGSVPWDGTRYDSASFVDDFLAGKKPELTSTTTSIGIAP